MMRAGYTHWDHKNNEVLVSDDELPFNHYISTVYLVIYQNQGLYTTAFGYYVEQVAEQFIRFLVLFGERSGLYTNCLITSLLGGRFDCFRIFNMDAALTIT